MAYFAGHNKGRTRTVDTMLLQLSGTVVNMYVNESLLRKPRSQPKVEGTQSNNNTAVLGFLPCLGLMTRSTLMQIDLICYYNSVQ